MKRAWTYFGVAGCVLSLCVPAWADIYSDLGAVHNTGLAPAGVNGTVTGGHEATGHQDTPFAAPDYDYVIDAGDATWGETRDFRWIHETSGSDPVTGTKWSFGTSGTQFVLLPSIDHDPIPTEGLEGTLWGSSDGGATWTKGTLTEVYDMGWSAASVDDDYASQWEFASAVNLISLTNGLTQGAYSFSDGDVEIDAVQMVPAPGAAVLAVLGLGCIGRIRRRLS